MKPEKRQVAYEQPSRTARRRGHTTAKTQKKEDPVLRCTLFRCWSALVVIVLCVLLTKTNPTLAGRVSTVYHSLLEAPLGQTAEVWNQAALEVGLTVLLGQVEESILVYAQGGQLVWDEQEGTLPDGVTLARPVFSVPASAPTNGVLSSGFGPRTHPITGKDDFHTGIDIAAPGGSGIFAAWPGTVLETGDSAIYGNYITIDHGGGVVSSYCHCQSVLAAGGVHLRAGERIATVGSTGISTGNHLHFEVRVNGQCADPLAAFDL